MKIELSHFQRVETSIAGKRKRGLAEAVPLAVSFVNHRRSKSKKKGSGNVRDDVQPQIVLTTEHKISIFGKDISDNTANLRESDIFRYSGRPIKSAAFLQNTEKLRCIPAMADLRANRMFALQEDNKKLISWLMNEDVERCVGCKLDSELLDLSLLQTIDQSYVYGTLKNHALAIAHVIKHTDQLSVQYFETEEDLKGADLLRTFILPQKVDQTVGQKRKSASDGSDNFICYQIFYRKEELIVVSWALSADLTKQQNRDSFSIPIKPKDSDIDISAIELLAHIEEEDSLVLSFHLNDKTKQSIEHCIATVSLLGKRFLYGPFVVSDAAGESGMLGNHFLAVRQTNHIDILDRKRGGIMAQVGSLPPVPFHLACDPVKPRFVLAFLEQTHISLFQYGLEIDRSAEPNLASLLSSARVVRDVPALIQHRYKVELQNDSASATLATNEAAVNVLDQARSLSEALSSGKVSPKELSVFVAEFFDILQSAGLITKTEDVLNGMTNKKVAVNGKKNGTHSATNGKPHKARKPLSKTDISDVCPKLASVCVDLLASCAKLRDSCSAAKLSKAVEVLVASKCFQPVVTLKYEDQLLSILEALRLGRTYSSTHNGYSALHFVFDSLESCSDFCEWQVVVMMRHILFRATDADFAEFYSTQNNGVEITAPKEFRYKKKDCHPNGTTPKTSSVTMKAVLSKFVDIVWSKSNCNPSLLRDAVTKTFSQIELQIVFKLLLSNSLLSSSSSYQKQVKDQAFTWLSTFCDILDLNTWNTPNARFLPEIDKAMKRYIRRTEQIVALQPLLLSAMDGVSEEKSSKSEQNTPRKTHVQLAPYQLERLAF